MLAAKRLDTKETMKKEICESTQTNYTLVQQKIECFADSTAKSMRKRKNRSCSTWPVHSNFVKDPKQGEREILSCSVNVCVRVYSTRGTTWFGVTTVDEREGQQFEQYWFITEYIALYKQAELLTAQVAQCTPRGVARHPAGTGWVQGSSKALQNDLFKKHFITLSFFTTIQQNYPTFLQICLFPDQRN
jgi:hypothetical protein